MDKPNDGTPSEHLREQVPEPEPEQMTLDLPGFQVSGATDPDRSPAAGTSPEISELLAEATSTIEPAGMEQDVPSAIFPPLGLSNELMTDELRDGESAPVRPVYAEMVEPPQALIPTPSGTGAGGNLPPPPSGDTEPEDEEDGGMLRMSFVEHLEEMRTRIVRAIAGVAVSFLACLVFAPQIWNVVSAPAVDALTKLGVNPPNLAIIEPMEGFSVIWVKVPLIVALFLAAPWVIYQIWAFIAPGLYDKEKRWAVPFVTITGGLFIAGGLFAYFVAFRFGLTFLLGIGLTSGGNVTPVVSITSYFDLFMNVVLGISLVFELPVAIFFLTLIRVASPRFLLRHSRYAVLLIVVLAAIITPTPDFFNLMIFAVPMCLLFFVGVFVSYLLVMHREGRKFPWAKVILGMLTSLLALSGVLYWALLKLGYHAVGYWPFMVK